MTAPLPTVIIMHPQENRKKCSVWPLNGRPDLCFLNWQRRPVEQRERYVRLGIGGPTLSMDDAESGILLLDATWRYAARMEADFEDLPVRGLPPLVTAYPRVSKLFDDPDGGLATVEALFAAHKLTGRSTEGLLDHYHWGETFLELNQAALAAI